MDWLVWLKLESDDDTNPSSVSMDETVPILIPIFIEKLRDRNP